MKQTITINWHDQDNRIQSEDRTTATVDALERATEMIDDGFIGGELNTEINGRLYSGWWTLCTAAELIEPKDDK